MKDEIPYAIHSFDQPEEPGADAHIQRAVRRVLTFLMAGFTNVVSVNVQVIYRERPDKKRIRAHSAIAALECLAHDPDRLVAHHEQAFIHHSGKLAIDTEIWEFVPRELRKLNS